MASRKPYKVMDRTRRVKMGLVASSLEELTLTSRRKLDYPGDKEVVVVLEEDGTVVDEEDYFQTLEFNTCLMLLHPGERWSPSSAKDGKEELGIKEETKDAGSGSEQGYSASNQEFFEVSALVLLEI